MSLTLTPEQKTVLKQALLAYRTKADQLKALDSQMVAKQAEVRAAFEAVLAALPTVDGRAPIDKFRWGATRYIVGAAGVYEVEDDMADLS